MNTRSFGKHPEAETKAAPDSGASKKADQVDGPRPPVPVVGYARGDADEVARAKRVIEHSAQETGGMKQRKTGPDPEHPGSFLYEDYTVYPDGKYKVVRLFHDLGHPDPWPEAPRFKPKGVPTTNMLRDRQPPVSSFIEAVRRSRGVLRHWGPMKASERGPLRPDLDRPGLAQLFAFLQEHPGEVKELLVVHHQDLSNDAVYYGFLAVKLRNLGVGIRAVQDSPDPVTAEVIEAVRTVYELEDSFEKMMSSCKTKRSRK